MKVLKKPGVDGSVDLPTDALKIEGLASGFSQRPWGTALGRDPFCNCEAQPEVKPARHVIIGQSILNGLIGTFVST